MSDISNSFDLPTYEELGLHIWTLCQDEALAMKLSDLDSQIPVWCHQDTISLSLLVLGGVEQLFKFLHSIEESLSTLR